MLRRARHTYNRRIKEKMNYCGKASLTIEAAFVMPIFLFAMLGLLYFIQIFTLQEFIQATITKMGLGLAKTAYVYEDFAGMEDALNFDESILGTEITIGLGDFAKTIVDQTIIKQYARQFLDTDRINASCIRDGFEGISFFDSKILSEDSMIDVVVSYDVVLPIRIFSLSAMKMLQRVRVRAWTGYEVAACYSVEEGGQDDIVYITETGSVYHLNATCSHIHLSIISIQGIPTTQRNDNGGKYYPCEKCGQGEQDPNGTYYITTDGTRYHRARSCSKIKRNVKEILKSEVGTRPLCKRCGG